MPCEEERRKQREIERQKQLEAIRNAFHSDEQDKTAAEEEKRKQRAIERQQALEAFRKQEQTIA